MQLQIEETSEADIELLLSPINTISWKEAELLVHFLKTQRETTLPCFHSRDELAGIFRVHRQYITILLSKLRRKNLVAIEKHPRFKIESGRGIVTHTAALQAYILAQLSKLNLSVTEILTQRERFEKIRDSRHPNTKQKPTTTLRVIESEVVSNNRNIDPNSDTNTHPNTKQKTTVVSCPQELVENKAVTQDTNTKQKPTDTGNGIDFMVVTQDPNTDPNTRQDDPSTLTGAIVENSEISYHIKNAEEIFSSLKSMTELKSEVDPNTGAEMVSLPKMSVLYIYNKYKIFFNLFPVYISKDIYTSNKYKKYKDFLQKSGSGAEAPFDQEMITDQNQEILKSNHPEKKTIAQRLLANRKQHSAETKKPSNSAPIIKLNKIALYWNSLEGTRKHNNPASNVYKAIVVRLNAYRRGSQGKLKWDSEWLRYSSITPALLDTELTEQQIMGILDEVRLLFDTSYWPPNKAGIPKDLATLLYDPRTQKSWFLHVHANGVKLLKEQATKKEHAKLGWELQRAYDALLEEINTIRDEAKGTLHENEEASLITLVKDLYKTHQQLVKSNPLDVPKKFEEYYKDYGGWLYNHLNMGMDIKIGILKVGGGWWKRFMKSVYGI